MSGASDTDRLLAAFVDELARCGLRHACTSPGSRCAPLVLALARNEQLRCFSHIDERCAGFFALGLAKDSYQPVAIACTSGTAVAELLPAVVEAREARVPLIVLSADRPPELREVGAGQTIDQLRIFGGFAKWFFDVGVLGDVSEQRARQEGAREEMARKQRTAAGAATGERWLRALACRAYWTALDGQPGAVHLNFALREPLVDAAQPAPPPTGGRPDGRPLVTRPAARAVLAGEGESLAAAVAGCCRGVVVAGRHERDTPLGEAAARFCADAGWPLLADPLSGARRGEAAIAHYDALLRDASFADSVRPDVVLRVGDLPTSKPLRQWLAGMPEVPQATIDAEGTWPDPDAALCRVFALEPAAALAALRAPRADLDWLASWRGADQRAAEAIRTALGGSGLSEPAVAAELGVLLPERATLFVSSSMPVRDVETFWPVRDDPPRVLCNRGANGIDGVVSSAFGVAAAAAGSGEGKGEPVVLLIGDVALAHDVGGLLAARRHRLKLTIVLIDNQGGGIFDFLPVSQAPLALQDDRYERHIATPTGLDFAGAACLYDLDHEAVTDVAGFRVAFERALASPRSTLLTVTGDRVQNLALHRRVWEAVSGAVSHSS